MTACTEALSYLRSPERQSSQYAPALTAVQDCLKVCNLSNDLKTKSSALHCKASELCIQACKSCMTACKASNDKNLQKCIDACQLLIVELSFEQLDQLRHDLDTIIAAYERWKPPSPMQSQQWKERLKNIEDQEKSLRENPSSPIEKYEALLDETSTFTFDLKRDLQRSVGGPCLTGPLP